LQGALIDVQSIHALLFKPDSLLGKVLLEAAAQGTPHSMGQLGDTQ
jgi:hypothetical protein